MYDPLVEPSLPKHPTEYELGRNLYWYWRMTCHGDKGQGLTAEICSIWEEDHLAQFASLQSLSDFLKATHPPQSPSILKDEEYHAIAFFVFAMNNRAPIAISAINTPSLMPAFTAIPAHTLTATPQESRSHSFPIYGVIVCYAFFVGILVPAMRPPLQNHEYGQLLMGGIQPHRFLFLFLEICGIQPARFFSSALCDVRGTIRVRRGNHT